MVVLRESEQGILRMIVGDYIETATPVGSGNIVRKHSLAVSPATVRSKMAVLEEQGYILRPHPSAGGVPSDKGYRFYVESLGEVPPMPLSIKLRIRRRFTGVKKDLEAWTRSATELLAQMSNNMALASFPRSSQSRLRHLQLVYIQESLVLIVLVLQEAQLRKELVPLKEHIAPEELVTASNKLNAYLSGLNRQEIAAKRLEMSPFEEMVVERTKGILKEEDQTVYQDFYTGGIKHLVSQPEFNGEKAKGIVDVVEDRRLLGVVLSGAAGAEGVRVIIGTENKEESMKPFSVVLHSYGIAGEVSGTIAVVGPTRMEYSQIMAEVAFISSLMSEIMGEVLNRGN